MQLDERAAFDTAAKSLSVTAWLSQQPCVGYENAKDKMRTDRTHSETFYTPAPMIGCLGRAINKRPIVSGHAGWEHLVPLTILYHFPLAALSVANPVGEDEVRIIQSVAIQCKKD